MLFTVTVIRINNSTSVFENTEVNEFMLKGDLEKELLQSGYSQDQIEESLEMSKGDCITLQSTITVGSNKGTRFSYIHRIS